MISLPARTHVALGLASIVTTALLVAVFAGLLPDRLGAVREGRVALAESVAVTSTALITANERKRLESVLRFLVERNAELLSVAVRDARGDLVAAAGEHSDWVPLEAGSANDSQIQVPLWSGQHRWGSSRCASGRWSRMAGEGCSSFPASCWACSCSCSASSRSTSICGACCGISIRRAPFRAGCALRSTP